MVEFQKLEPIQLNRKINEFSPLKLNSKIFSASHLWEIPNEELYPDEIKDEIKGLKTLITGFIQSGYSPEFCNQNMRKFKMFRKLALNLARHENIIDAIIYSKYWINSSHWRYLGIEIARILVFAENIEHGEIPTTESRARKFEMCRKILTAIKSGTWRRYGSWNEFLRGLYGENWKRMAKFIKEFPFEKLIKQLPYLDFHEPDEHESASQNFLREFSKKNTAETIKDLYYTCQMGFYEKNGIYSWHELLYWCQTFSPLQDQFYFWKLDWNDKFHAQFIDSFLPVAFSKRYSSRKGLEIVAQDLYNFKMYLDRNPTQFDFPFVLNILDAREWRKYGISSWESLVEYSLKLKL